MNSSIRFIYKFRIVLSIVTIAPLWLMLVAADSSANAQTASSPADWTEFHRNNMQRWNPYETGLGVNTVASLKLKWNNPVGVYRSFAPSSTAVVNGVVYFGSDDGNVYALNANTGARLWSFATGAIVDSSPAVANGVVYVGSDDNNLYALDANTGALIWKFTANSPIDSSPAVVNGVVYFSVTTYYVYALNANTGALIWKSDAYGGPLESSPAVVNGVIYFGSGVGSFAALNASTGAHLWSVIGLYAVSSSPAVSNGVVYFGADDDNVYALDATTGTKLWSYTTGGAVDSSPAVANGVVYVGSGDGNVYALNASTGALLWRFNTGSRVGLLFSSPAVADGVIYIGSANGNVYALNASTGAKLWSYATGGNTVSSPAIVDGVLYFRAAAATGVSSGPGGPGNVYAFSLGSADLFLRIIPSTTTVHHGDLLTFAFPVWNLGPDVAEGEVLSNLQVPAGTTFDYVRISGTPGLGTCTHPPYGGTGQIICHEGDGMAPNTTWTVRLTVKVTAPAGTTITESAATMSDTPDPNMANNMATVSVKVQ